MTGFKMVNNPVVTAAQPKKTIQLAAQSLTSSALPGASSFIYTTLSRAERINAIRTF